MTLMWRALPPHNLSLYLNTVPLAPFDNVRAFSSIETGNRGRSVHILKRRRCHDKRGKNPGGTVRRSSRFSL